MQNQNGFCCSSIRIYEIQLGRLCTQSTGVLHLKSSTFRFPVEKPVLIIVFLGVLEVIPFCFSSKCQINGDK